MRYRIFLDTNILISGIFFEGNESKILDTLVLDLIISEDDVVDELKKITKRKLINTLADVPLRLHYQR